MNTPIDWSHTCHSEAANEHTPLHARTFKKLWTNYVIPLKALYEHGDANAHRLSAITLRRYVDARLGDRPFMDIIGV